MLTQASLSLKDVWREHVLHSVDWTALVAAPSRRGGADAALFLDVFLGGTIRHEPDDGSFACRSCPFDPLSEAEPGCECHLGIVAAFLEGCTGAGYVVTRKPDGGLCRIEYREAA